MKTVETELSSENIVKIEEMSDGRWKITQSNDPKYGLETNVEKNADGVWVVTEIHSKDVTKELNHREQVSINARVAGYGGRVGNVKKHSNGSYSVSMKKNYRPPTSSLLHHSSPFEDGRLPYRVYLEPQRIFEEPEYKDSVIELSAGEIVDIKKMPDGRWKITQNIEE